LYPLLRRLIIYFQCLIRIADRWDTTSWQYFDVLDVSQPFDEFDEKAFDELDLSMVSFLCCSIDDRIYSF
jgi:hypothetical protein